MRIRNNFTAALLLGLGLAGMASGQKKPVEYEVWAADQSNTAAGQPSLAVKGGYLWIWNGKDVERQEKDPKFVAKPLPCTPTKTAGPCDMLEMFPGDLKSSLNMAELDTLTGFGRFHGVQIDPQNKYVAISMFASNGGYIGVVDTKTREAIALFRATMFDIGPNPNRRSVHMNFWSAVSVFVYDAEYRAPAAVS